MVCGTTGLVHKLHALVVFPHGSFCARILSGCRAGQRCWTTVASLPHVPMELLHAGARNKNKQTQFVSHATTRNAVLEACASHFPALPCRSWCTAVGSRAAGRPCSHGLRPLGALPLGQFRALFVVPVPLPQQGFPLYWRPPRWADLGRCGRVVCPPPG